jgi:hypothetical protein
MTECLPNETTAATANTSNGTATQYRIVLRGRSIGRILSPCRRRAVLFQRQNVIIKTGDGKTKARWRRDGGEYLGIAAVAEYRYLALPRWTEGPAAR